MSHARWSRRHVRFLVFLTAVLALAGAAVGLRLPVSLFPHVSFPRVQVTIDVGDQPAERMALEVTRPIEEAVRVVPGVQRVRSTTSRGSAQVFVDFPWGSDILAAMLQVESEVNRLLPELPPGATLRVQRMDPTFFPTLAFSITSPSHSLSQLRDLATYEIRPSLTTVAGVTQVEVQGGEVEEFHVVADPTRLAAYGLTIDDLAKRLSASNVLSSAGRVEDRYKLELVITDTQFKGEADIAAAVLKSPAGGGGGIVRVSDVASVRVAATPQFIRVTADGRAAVLLQVYQSPDANTVQIAADIRERLAGMERRLPEGIRIANWYDQSDLILSSARTVAEATLLGIGLAGLVLLVFLRDWRTTLIATIAVPTVLAATVLVLYVLGMSFNVMTLGGMAAAVGLIIDDAIVMVEHIARRLHGEGGGGAEARILDAADEFTRPLAGSSASTIVIHIPPAFLLGVAGAFFAALSMTMAASLCISFAISWLVIPALAGPLLRRVGRRERPSAPAAAAPTSRVGRMYGELAEPFLRWPWLVLPLVLLITACGYLAFRHLETGFMPTMDEGGFAIDYLSPPGTSVTETDRLLRQVEAILADTPEVQTYSRRTGLQLGGAITESNAGDFFVRLKPFPRRGIEDVMSDLRDRIEQTVPGLEIETPQLMEDVIGDLTAVPQPVEVKLFGDDPAALLAAGPVVAEAIGKVKGLVEVKSGVVPAGDALTVEIDRNRVALEGSDPEDVSKQLGDLMGGRVATSVRKGPKIVGVRAWIPAKARANEADVLKLQLRAPDGHLFPVSRVASVKRVTGEPEITHEDLKRLVSVTGRIEERDLGSVVRDVEAIMDRPGMLPAGVSYRLGGLYQEQQQAFRGMMMVIAAAAVLVFLVLLFLYESFRVATAILSISALALAAVMVGLWLTRTHLNVSSLMGMVMIVGNVTEVAVFLYSEFAALSPATGSRAERLAVAARNRMRAITMTTASAILALLPLAIGLGSGGGMLQPLATAIIVGLVVQLPLVLIVLPAVLLLLGVDARSGPMAASDSGSG